MNIETIAEFVENEEILNELREIGVDYAQGYYVGHPARMENGGVAEETEKARKTKAG